MFDTLIYFSSSKNSSYISTRKFIYFTHGCFIRGIILSHLVGGIGIANFSKLYTQRFKRIKRTFDESRRWAPIAFIINVIRCTWGAHEHVVMRPVYTTLAKDIDIVGNANANTTILSIPELLSISNETVNESANWSANYKARIVSSRGKDWISCNEE